MTRRPMRVGRRLNRTCAAIAVVAVAAAVGLASLTLGLNARDSHRLLQLQANDASVSVTSLLTQIKSSMASIGAVAAATGATPASLRQVVGQESAMVAFASVAVLRTGHGPAPAVTAVRGSPAVVGDTGGLSPYGQQVDSRLRTGAGLQVLGFVGRGAGRTLALLMGAPAVPSGYGVYAELPLPAGITVKSPFPRLSIAVYNGADGRAPLIFASTHQLPLRGDQVGVLIDLNRAVVTSAPAATGPVLRFVVATSGSLLSPLERLLPWLLAALALITGGLAVRAVQSAAARRDRAIAVARDLHEKNAELDQAMARSLEAERARQLLEAELQQAQRLEAVGQLAGGIAHDFNNLLMVIQTHVDFLAEELPADDDAQADLAEVRGAATRAADLTRRLLVFSRRDLVRPSPLEVNETITEVVRMLRRSVGEDVTLIADLSPGLPAVLCDAGELHQVMVNLVVNARQAITGSGSILVRTEPVQLDRAALPAGSDLRPGPAVRISVTDDGCGMSPATAARAFEPYFTTKEAGSGTGLGLATVYGIVRRYGGHIGLDSEAGTGTTVTVYLPATGVAADPEPAPAPPAAAPAGTATVLLVEDEDGVRRACQRILEGGGYRVRTAGTAAEALDGYAPEDFDVLVTDVVMPGGLSGRDLVQRMQQTRPVLPVLYMSGYSRDEIATRGVLEEGITVIEKPFTPEQLLGAVGSVLAGATPVGA